LGMVVVARTDSHSVRDDAAAAHPEWIAVDAQGNKRKHWAAPNRWVTCAYGPYNFEFMTEVHKEIAAKYPVQGIFTNRWQGSGMWLVAKRKNGKEFHETFGRKSIVGIASIGIDDDHRWKDSVISDPELRIWLADGVANGLRPWIVKFCGTIYDKRWMPVVEK